MLQTCRPHFWRRSLILPDSPNLSRKGIDFCKSHVVGFPCCPPCFETSEVLAFFPPLRRIRLTSFLEVFSRYLHLGRLFHVFTSGQVERLRSPISSTPERDACCRQRCGSPSCREATEGLTKTQPHRNMQCSRVHLYTPGGYRPLPSRPEQGDRSVSSGTHPFGA